MFRFSNVYGRYDSDLQRMERVLPLFMHQLSRGEPITVYGGDEKVLDFTYIDDCIDGIVRGVDGLAQRARSTNETINLAFGQGNTLVRAAELIAGALGVDAGDRLQALAPRRGHPLRRRCPQGAGAPRLAAADPARGRDPARRRMVPRVAGRASRGEPRDRPRARSRRDRARVQDRRGLITVVALFGPTASGKSAVARALQERLGGEIVSADSAALYAGIPILTAAPGYPARLVGVVPLEHEVSVGGYQRLAHEAIDEIVADGGTAIVAGGTGLYFRAALSELGLPPRTGAPARESDGAPCTTSSAPRRRTRCSPSAIPPRRHASTRTTAGG